MCKNCIDIKLPSPVLPLHYDALLLLFEPARIILSWAHNRRAQLFINLVAIGTEAGHIGGTAPVRQLLINENFGTGQLFIYLSLNGNPISSVIRPV